MADVFPFQLEDIQHWIIKKKDGTVVKYSLVTAADIQKDTKKAAPPVKQANYYTTYPKSGYGSWCKHSPDPTTDDPIFSNGKINLFVGDNPGAKDHTDKFDVVLDGGGVIDIGYSEGVPDIYGDRGFTALLSKHTYWDIIARQKQAEKADNGKARIIKLHWADRAAPPVTPEFWDAFYAELCKIQKGLKRPLNVMTVCQGGHGRSGSACVILMMLMTDYTPLDALTHIRAIHCARAIESKVQHEYLNKIAKHLNRAENALEAENVKSYKDRLLAEAVYPDALKTRVREGKGAGSREREAGFL